MELLNEGEDAAEGGVIQVGGDDGGDEGENEHGPATHGDELRGGGGLARQLLGLAVNVHREERRGRVEHRGERAHDGAEEGREDEPGPAGVGQQALEQRGKGRVVVIADESGGDAVLVGVLAGLLGDLFIDLEDGVGRSSALLGFRGGNHVQVLCGGDQARLLLGRGAGVVGVLRDEFEGVHLDIRTDESRGADLVDGQLAALAALLSHGLDDLVRALVRDGLEVVAEEVVGEDARYDDDEGHQQLEEGGEDDAELAFFKALGGQGALHDVLVEAPVEEVGDPEAEQVDRPGHGRVIGRAHHVQLAGNAVDGGGGFAVIERPESRCAVDDGAAGALQGAGDVSVDEVRRGDGGGVNHAGAAGGIRIHAAEGREGEVGDDAAADEQAGTPDEVRPSAGFQTADVDVDGGADGDDDAACGHGEVKVDGDDGRAGVDDGGGGHADEDEQVGDGHCHSGNAVEALFQELRDGEDAALEQHRQEGEGDDDEHDGGQPFIAGDGDAQPVGCLSAHADELLGGDVGGEQGEAHEPPAQAAAGEEVVRGSAFLVVAVVALFIAGTGLPDAEADDADDDDAEDDHLPDREDFDVFFNGVVGGFFVIHGALDDVGGRLVALHDGGDGAAAVRCRGRCGGSGGRGGLCGCRGGGRGGCSCGIRRRCDGGRGGIRLNGGAVLRDGARAQERQGAQSCK